MRKLGKVLLVVSISALAVCSGAYGYYNYRNPSIDIEKSVVQIEYGTTMQEANNLIKENVNTSGADVETIFGNESSLAPVGTYIVPVSYRDSASNFKVEVKDTTPPELTIDVDKLNKTYDNGYVTENTFVQYSSATDLSECEISVELPENFNNTIAGDYTCTIVAEDEYNNTSDVEVSFSIAEPAQSSGNSISIDSIGVSNALIGVGDDQDAVNQFDVLLMSQFNTPGSGEPILMAGHNTRSFENLSNVKIGDIIKVLWNGTEYQYKVTFSGIVTTTGSDLSNKETGENMIEYSGREVLQMYTCHKIFADNERWMIKADPVK